MQPEAYREKARIPKKEIVPSCLKSGDDLSHENIEKHALYSLWIQPWLAWGLEEGGGVGPLGVAARQLENLVVPPGERIFSVPKKLGCVSENLES